jgi:hypothetical protein
MWSLKLKMHLLFSSIPYLLCPTHFTFYVQAQILPHTNILSEGIHIQNIPPTSYCYSIWKCTITHWSMPPFYTTTTHSTEHAPLILLKLLSSKCHTISQVLRFCHEICQIPWPSWYFITYYSTFNSVELLTTHSSHAGCLQLSNQHA